MHNYRLRIITTEIMDRFTDIKAKTDEARQDLHETQEKIKDNQLQRELEEMELEVLRLKYLRKYEESIHQKKMKDLSWGTLRLKKLKNLEEENA